MPKTTGNREQFFNALDESYDALVEAIKASNERGYRFSKRLIADVEQGQRDLIQLGRRFARQPRDMRGLYESSVDLARRAAGHSAELARQMVTDAGTAGLELRQTARTVVRANRAATQALASVLQGAARDLAERPRRLVRRPAAKRPATRRRARRRVQRPAPSAAPPPASPPTAL